MPHAKLLFLQLRLKAKRSIQNNKNTQHRVEYILKYNVLVCFRDILSVTMLWHWHDMRIFWFIDACPVYSGGRCSEEAPLVDQNKRGRTPEKHVMKGKWLLHTVCANRTVTHESNQEEVNEIQGLCMSIYVHHLCPHSEPHDKNWLQSQPVRWHFQPTVTLAAQGVQMAGNKRSRDYTHTVVQNKNKRMQWGYNEERWFIVLAHAFCY